MTTRERQSVTLRIEAMAHDGRGIGFLPGHGRGHAVFVSGALPGQTALCRLAYEKKNLLEATLEKVLDAGPITENPICPHSDICGGCPLQRMPYNLQLRWKERLLKDALTRIGGIDSRKLETMWHPVIPSPEITEFRNKLTLAFGYDVEGIACLGMRRRESHEVFSLRLCALANAGALPIIQFMEKAMLSSGLPPIANGVGFWKQLVLRQDLSRENRHSWRALLLTALPSEAQKRLVTQIGKELLASIPSCSGFIHDVSTGAESPRMRKRLACLNQDGQENAEAARMEQFLEGRSFNFDVSSFMQVNAAAAEELAKLARKMSSQCQNKKGLLDIYCGSGFPGQLLGKDFDALLGIETDSAAVASASHNAGKENRWRYLKGDAGRILKSGKINGEWPAVLLDPPRAGADGRVLEWLRKKKPENIIYVSCNPATLARDIKSLESSHELQAIGAVDMFPHTPHVETCALLQSKSIRHSPARWQ